MPEQTMRICGVRTHFTRGEAENQTVITVKSAPPALPLAWLNFLHQRLHLLHLDYARIGAEAIVVISTTHAADSVARLVISAIESADHHVKTVMRNIRAQGVRDVDAEQWLQRRQARIANRAIADG